MKLSYGSLTYLNEFRNFGPWNVNNWQFTGRRRRRGVNELLRNLVNVNVVEVIRYFLQMGTCQSHANEARSNSLNDNAR